MNVNDSDFINVQLEALPITVQGCIVKNEFSFPQNKVGFIHLLMSFVTEKNFLRLLWNDEQCVSHPRTEMIPSGESGVQILKGGI